MYQQSSSSVLLKLAIAEVLALFLKQSAFNKNLFKVAQWLGSGATQLTVMNILFKFTKCCVNDYVL